MKMKIYLDTDGQELHALGKHVWSWNYHLREEGTDGQKGAVLVGECEVTIPEKEVCIPVVLEALKAREQEINAQAYEDLGKIKERRDNLLMLTMEEAK